jgi:hypothetical protein
MRVQRFGVFVKIGMTIVCTVGIAFYVRFLVALWKEREPRASGYWVRLRLRYVEDSIAQLPERRKPVTRAA